jgi:Ca2+-binding EF-hand superfamily protein
MSPHRNPILAIFGLLTVFAAPLGLSPSAFATNALTAADTDKDGTLDLAEVKVAAGAAFDGLDQDKDSTLDLKEAASRLSKPEFKAADTDNDTTLTKDEYLALVEKLFKAADKNNDGTLNAAELRTKAGRALERLLK